MKSFRSEVGKDVQARLNAGDRKDAIYRELKNKYSAAAVARSLAQWPYPEDKAKNRFLNIPLMIIVIAFAVLKLLQIIAVFQTLEPAQILKVLPLAALPIIIYAYIIYGVKNFNLIGYILTILFSLNTLVSIRGINPTTMMPLVLGVTAIVLAGMQKTRLFPNTSWLMRHKKDENGNPIF